METTEYLTIARVGEIPEGQGRMVLVRSRPIAVFHSGGSYFAMDDTCPHMGASLAEGSLDGEHVYCPWHAWRFRLQDGLWADNPKSKICNHTYQLRVMGDEIQILLSSFS